MDSRSFDCRKVARLSEGKMRTSQDDVHEMPILSRGCSPMVPAMKPHLDIQEPNRIRLRVRIGCGGPAQHLA